MPSPRAFRAVAAIALVAAWALPSRAAAPRPNIVYIVSDDQGWKDVGFHGSDIRTPNLDELAKGGARLEQFYAQPMCTPSRAALMTGRYPHRYGLQTLVIPSNAGYGLATDEWLLPQALKEAGYQTAIVGKWHLGHADRKFWPGERGFDYQYGPLLGEIDHYTHSVDDTRDWYRNGKALKEQGYATTLLGTDAVQQIEHHDPAKPLFLYLAFTAPHTPYQAPKEAEARYKAVADSTRRTYAAMITVMDEQIGRVLAALDKRGMRSNTLIVFQSDNGGPRSTQFLADVERSKSKLPADNGPYRDGKASLFEGGTRVVALANWPGHIPAGTTVDQMIHVVDMYPTLGALAGAAMTKNKPLDGLDVWPAIAEGKPSPRDEIVYDIEPSRAAIRRGDWKLLWKSTLPAQVMLFDLAKDPSETNNLADAQPAKVAELQGRLSALAHDAVEPLYCEDAFGVFEPVILGALALPNEKDSVETKP